MLGVTCGVLSVTTALDEMSKLLAVELYHNGLTAAGGSLHTLQTTTASLLAAASPKQTCLTGLVPSTLVLLVLVLLLTELCKVDTSE